MQSIFGGATDYNEQTLDDIYKDIVCWIKYTKEVKDYIDNKLDESLKSGFWNEVYDKAKKFIKGMNL